ncbi:MAG: zinc-binding dehydrogenase [Saprospiraceae bacterium]|nr:zinc-binding dehydrogenase [Saprospiraceae bacterium]
MKAVQIKDKGYFPEYLEVPIPDDKAGYHKLQVSHASLNHRDVWIMQGQYAGLKYPIIPGSDACGYFNGQRWIVNPGLFWGTNEKFQSKSFQILGLPDNGSMAEWVNVPVENLAGAPEHLDDVQASALGLAGVTAYRALVSRCTPQPGERLLVTGIGGGVALFVLQIAHLLGLEVYVTSSSQAKLESARQLGAAGGVLYTDSDWTGKLIEMNPSGFDIIIDSYAGDQVEKMMKLINPGGRFCFYGGTGGKIQNLSPQILFWKQISIFGSTMGSLHDFLEFLKLVNQFRLVPVIDSVFDLTDVQRGFQRMQQSQQFGKIVFRIQAK